MAKVQRAPVYDPAMGHIDIYSAKAQLPAALKTLIDDRISRETHRHTNGAGGAAIDLPRADYYITTGQDSARLQRNAIRAGCSMVIVLPAAGEWLRGKLNERAAQGKRTVVWVSGGAW